MHVRRRPRALANALSTRFADELRSAVNGDTNRATHERRRQPARIFPGAQRRLWRELAEYHVEVVTSVIAVAAPPTRTEMSRPPAAPTRSAIHDPKAFWPRLQRSASVIPNWLAERMRARFPDALRACAPPNRRCAPWTRAESGVSEPTQIRRRRRTVQDQQNDDSDDSGEHCAIYGGRSQRRSSRGVFMTSTSEFRIEKPVAA